MKSEEFLRLLGGIDKKYVEKASDDLNFWLESQRGISVRPDNTRVSLWRTAIMSASCTAAVMIGVFAFLLNMGIVGKTLVTGDPASSGVELSNSSGGFHELPPEGYLYEEAAYAYAADDSNVLKRYEAGDIFGGHKLMSAKTTYKLSDGMQIRQKQEISVEGHFMFNLVRSKTDDAALDIDIGSWADLGLPYLLKDFDERMLSYYPSSVRSFSYDDTMKIIFYDLNITVDHEEKTVTLAAQKFSVLE